MTKQRPEAYPHQHEGSDFLTSRESAALFDEPGLGKSRQVIDTVMQGIETDSFQGALIVCPNTLKTTWAEEVEKHSDLSCAVFGSGKQARRNAFRSLTAAFYVINYEAVATELPSLRALLRFKPMALILDESHRIKSPGARVTQAIHQLRHDAERRYIMTGTPVANKPEDLWSQIYFLDGGSSLGASFEEFRARFCTSGGGYTQVEEIRAQLNEIALRRRKDDTLSLPKKTVARVRVSLRGQQLSLYEQMRDEMAVWVESLDGEQVRRDGEAILARLVRLAQLASNPRLLDASYEETPAKFTQLDELLTGYLEKADAKVIVWTSFVDNIPLLVERYAEHSPVALHGRMDRSARDRAVVAFRTDPATRLLVANPAAAREGLTLTSAQTAIYLDRTFNLVDFLQSQDRIHRISQEKPCEIVVLVASNTIDEFVDYSLEQKHRLAAFTQGDSDSISPQDLALEKPALLRALLQST